MSLKCYFLDMSQVVFSFRNSFCNVRFSICEEKTSSLYWIENKVPFCFKEHVVDLIFLLTLAVDQIASQVFDGFS